MGGLRIYIAGPMTGLPGLNLKAFKAAEEKLRKKGYDVFNPGTNPPGKTFRWYMAVDLPEVIHSDGLALLPGWEGSKGARLEKTVATECGLDVRRLEDW